jgi:transposase-like protein
LRVGKRKQRPGRGRHFKLHQVACDKPLRDLRHQRVRAQRYRCLSCQRTFRVYPRGVSAAQQSSNLKALSVLLYVLGLSYQGVSDLLDALGQPMSKSSAYNNVQAAGARAIELRGQWLQQHAASIKVLGIDCTHVKRLGQDTIVVVASAILTGEALSIEVLADESAQTILPWAQKLSASLQAEVLVTDDAALVIHAGAVGLACIVNTLGVEGRWRQFSRAMALDPPPLPLPLDRRIAACRECIGVTLAGGQ